MATRKDRGRRLTGDLVRYERALREQGFTRVAGADEAGRGALAGPLVAAAVVLPDGFDPEGIDDSKLLTRNQREAAFERIVAVATYAVAKVEPGVIDSRGLHRSNVALLRRCVRALDPAPEYALTDGFPVPRMPIVAKVTRDRIMVRMHRRYPAFGFDHNVGYGTPEHLEVLDRVGPTPIHRLSFACVGQPLLPGMERSVGRPAWDTTTRESMTP
jgi:ribonuclease HII